MLAQNVIKICYFIIIILSNFLKFRYYLKLSTETLSKIPEANQYFLGAQKAKRSVKR